MEKDLKIKDIIKLKDYPTRVLNGSEEQYK